MKTQDKTSKVLGLFFFILGASYLSTAHAIPCGTLGGPLNTEDVTLNLANSVNCGGIYQGNNSNIDINNINLGELTFSGSDWGNEIKDDGTGSGTGSFLGINWTLSANTGTTDSWTLSISDPNSNLPANVDVLAALKGSNKWAAYLFTNQTFATEGPTNGSFKIAFTNNGGNIPDLSHMSIYLRESAITPVPVPAATWLFGSGLLGLAGFTRKRKRL
jgi:hypothetical protein